jgi:polar amino acid transport system substrate-binding protein
VIAKLLRPARICGPAGVLLAVIACAAAAQNDTRPLFNHRAASDHHTAMSALDDIKLAIRSIVSAENDSSTGPGHFKNDAQQAINVLVGRQDAAYKALGGSSKIGDDAGAIGNINHLLDRTASPPWVPALHGALANIEAAVARLQDAQNAKGLMRYQIAISQSLINLEVAEGRRSEIGVLGGMNGAIANTELAVPNGAKVVDGCAAPTMAPAYGVHAGYLVYRTAPLRQANGQNMDSTIANPGGMTISAHDGFLVFNLPASAKLHQLCAAKPNMTTSSTEG